MILLGSKGHSAYRYSFNGMEKDDEITGVQGSHLDFGARIYDSRIGRFLSPDPKERIYSSQSTYCFAANNPIRLIDVNGEGPGDPVDGELSNTAESDKKYTTTLENKPGMIYVIAPDGELHGFKAEGFDYTYSDGKEHNGGHKIEGVWQVKTSEGHFMWNNVEGKFVQNTSGTVPGGNSVAGVDFDNTYAGSNNPPDYSQPPQNIADAGGLVHDKAYDVLFLVGFEGVMNPLSKPANDVLIEHSQMVIDMYLNGEIDPWTGMPVTMQTYHSALMMQRGFQIAEALKIERDRNQMIRLEQEYELFMNEEYMNNGGWERVFGVQIPN